MRYIQLQLKRQYVFYFLLINISLLNAQKIVSDNINDTISVDNFGGKIALENDLKLGEKMNDDLLKIIKVRKRIKNLNPKIKEYYETAYYAIMLSKSFFEEKKGNYKKTTEILFSVLRELNPKKYYLIGDVYNKIGVAFLLQNDLNKSFFYTNKSLEYALKSANQILIAACYHNIAVNLHKKNENKKSLYFFKKALQIFKKTNDIAGETSVLFNIGNLQCNDGNIIEGKKNLILALKKQNLVKDFENACKTSFNLSIQSKNDEAFFYCKEAYNLAITYKNLNVIVKAGIRLSELYQSQGKYKESLDVYKKAIETREILEQGDNKNAVIKAEFKYETEKKEAQIKSLSQQKKIATLESQRQKTIALVLGIAIISILITSYFLFNRYKIKKQNELLKSQLLQAEKTIEAEKKATESELKALKSQMNPHFIFNALSSIQDQFMFGDKVTANEQMGNFTYLTRQILNVSGKKQILLSTEIDILSKYLELEKMRFKTDFEYAITTSKNIDEDYHEIPPMLIQPFVENSIKHGLLHKSGLKKVSVDFELDAKEEYIICTIIDNGIGRQKSAEIKAKNQNNHQSFSTESIAQRLELLNENHSITELITYSDEIENNVVAGTKVVINIPLA